MRAVDVPLLFSIASPAWCPAAMLPKGDSQKYGGGFLTRRGMRVNDNSRFVIDRKKKIHTAPFGRFMGLSITE
jgi:hypothetical protein